MFQIISAIVLRRLLLAIPTLLLLSLVVFVVLRMLPVDPLAMLLPASATAADAAALRQQLGFDKPIPQQFLIWLWKAVNGNLGSSINFRQPVVQLMLAAVPATLELTLTGLLLALVDLLLVGRFEAWLSAVSHLLLPALALALGFAPLVIRVLRSSLIDAANEPYVEVARLRGLSETRILWRHMLKNASLPTVTMIGVQFGFLFGGALLVEMIFCFPGVGNPCRTPATRPASPGVGGRRHTAGDPAAGRVRTLGGAS